MPEEIEHIKTEFEKFEHIIDLYMAGNIDSNEDLYEVLKQFFKEKYDTHKRNDRGCDQCCGC